MSRVIVHSGLTLPGKQEFAHFRADVTFEVDPDGDVEAQLESCIAAHEQTSIAVETRLCQQASDTSGLNFEGMGVADELKEFKAKLKKSWLKMAAEVEKHGNILEAAKAAGLLVVELGEEEPEEEEEEEEEKPRRRTRRTEPEEEPEEEEKPKRKSRRAAKEEEEEAPKSRRRGTLEKLRGNGESKSRSAPTRKRTRANRK